MPDGPGNRSPAEDLLLELRELVKKISQPAERHRLAWLNTPFVVTALAGFVGALLSLFWQSNISRITAEQRYHLHRYEQKQQVFREFSDSIAVSLNIPYRMMLRSTWIHTHKDDRPRPDYPDGRSFADTVKNYEELRERYYAQRNALSLCAVVKAQFDSERVQSRAVKLSSLVDGLLSATTEDAVKKCHTEADDFYLGVIEAMGAELRAMETTIKGVYQ